MGTVFQLLESEWCRLSRDPMAARRLRDVCRLAGSAPDLGALEHYVRHAGPEAADRVLLALVARALDGDDLAARTVLQLLLPGTRNLARRWWALGDADERAAAAVTAVYHRIRHYPLERRPGRVAANILMDAARELRRATARSGESVPVADPAGQRADEPEAHPAVELADALVAAVDAGTISRDDAQVIAQSRIGGTRIERLAAHRGVSSRTLWARRQRAERQLRAS
jgi:DNA-directed RNA polymerase specialized sigma24 family protein